MRILITGSQGRIGGFVTRALEPAHELILLDTQPAPDSPHRFFQGDLCDPQLVTRALEGVDAVAHLAANLSPSPQTYQRNTVGTWNLCAAAAEAGVRRVVFSSSINVYGQGRYKIGRREFPPPYLPIDEDVPPRPEDSYGLSKWANEQALRGFSDAYGIRAYCLRLPAVWVPARTEGYAPPPLEKCPALTPTRVIDPWHYIDVRDVAAAFQMALESPRLPEFGVSYLLADDTTRPEPTAELFTRFLPEWLRLGADRIPGHAPWFSSARARADLGWRPQYTWRRAKE